MAANTPGTQQQTKGDSGFLTSTSDNEAYNPSGGRFSIADPTINVLNQRAGGNQVPVSSSGIVGMPKGTYGFATAKFYCDQRRPLPPVRLTEAVQWAQAPPSWV